MLVVLGGVKLVESRLSNTRETLSEAAVVDGDRKRFRFRDSFEVPPTVPLLTFDLMGPRVAASGPRVLSGAVSNPAAPRVQTETHRCFELQRNFI